MYRKLLIISTVVLLLACSDAKEIPAETSPDIQSPEYTYRTLAFANDSEPPMVVINTSYEVRVRKEGDKQVIGMANRAKATKMYLVFERELSLQAIDKTAIPPDIAKTCNITYTYAGEWGGTCTIDGDTVALQSTEYTFDFEEELREVLKLA